MLFLCLNRHYIKRLRSVKLGFKSLLPLTYISVKVSIGLQ
jgi:hypothetical protein